jgi:hypothetical protein
MRREALRGNLSLRSPQVTTQEYVTPDFGCILHSDIDTDDMD